MRSWKIPGGVMNQQTNGIYEFGSFRLDAQERLLQRDGAAISLTPKAFDLLLALVERHGHLLEKDELLKKVWPDTFVEESNLSSNISLLRKALGDGENGQKFIETVPKRGYRFVAEVREAPREANEPAPDAPLPINAAPVAAVQPRHRFHALLLVLLAPALLVVGYYARARWFASRVSNVAPLPTIAPFTTLPGRESEPTFSPDGNSIAFTWDGEQGDNVDIWVKQIGNESMHRLTTDPAAEHWPRWSPDGRYIAFIRQGGLYLIPSLGGAERKIATLEKFSTTDLEPRARMPNWTPDSEWLAVVDRSSTAEPFGIWLVARGTGEKRRLTTPTSSTETDRSPAISPDGKMVVFARASGDVGRLYLVPIAGGEPKKWNPNEEILSLSPAWSPDGRSILFGSNGGLWKAPVTGGAPERIEAVRGNLEGFALSPQGNRLVWVQTINDYNIWRIGLPATAANPGSKRLIASTRIETSQQYSPDGSKIVFASDRSGSMEIWVCDSEGRRLVQLTSFNRSLCGSPRWSPDGRQIVFDSRAEGSADIYVISVEGGKPRRLTTEPSADIVPSWSRDGNWIYFCSDRSGSQQIWKMPAAGGPAVQVTNGGGFDNVESPDGQFLYYTKGRFLPGIWRVPVMGGEETLVLDQHRAGELRFWAVTEKGIYFASAENPAQPRIEFFDFATNRVATIVALEKLLQKQTSGLAVSPDGRWLTWSQIDQVSSDIMLMENFR
jgi:Tol biopolymer transport system component/DNA-binding winged helix-turn-helix (wHTH) protein